MSAQGTIAQDAPARRDPLAEWGTARRRRNRLIVTAAVGGLAAASVATNVGAALGGGVPAAGRLALGLLGLAAVAVLWARPWLGARLALAWAALQIPVVDWTGDGSPTAQALDFPLVFSSASRVVENGVVVSENYFAAGINIVGIILATWLASRREIVERPN